MARSFLFSPGDSAKKISKGPQSDADAIIIDLEDAVVPNMKAEARQITVDALRELDFGERLCLVRVNPAASGLIWDDLSALFAEEIGIDGIVLPKVEFAKDVESVVAWLAKNGRELPIYALIESAMGVINVAQIAASSDWLHGLMLGGEDLVASLEARATAERGELLYARGAVVTAAAAYGLQAIDTVYLNFRDDDGLRHDCATAAQLGFSGKLAIHPRQVAVMNEAFLPSDAEIEWATELLEAFDHRLADSAGVFAFRGEMIDEAIVKRARRIQEQAR